MDIGLGLLPSSLRKAAPAPASLQVSVAASADDAAETNSTNNTNIINTTLQLTDSSDQQTVGIRFLVPTLPQGATILSAQIQFTAGATNASSGAVILIEGLDQDAAPAFSAGVGNADITGRPGTTAKVTWNATAGWTLGERGANQLTPDLSGSVQEIVDRPGFNGVLGFRFRDDGTSLATRNAAAADHLTLQEATITVTYMEGENFIATLDPVAWYKFDDGAGVQLTDHSGNGRHGTLGSPTATPTWTAEGLSFDGGDFVALSPALPIVQGIDIVFKPAVAYSAASAREIILATVGVNAVESGVHFGSVTGALTDEILTVLQQADEDGFAANGRRAWTHATDTLTADWHLLQIDWLGGTPYFNIVLDGVDKANALVLTLEPWKSAIWRIGREITGPPGFAGSIAYLVFYPTGRSTQQQADAAAFLAVALAPRGIIL